MPRLFISRLLETFFRRKWLYLLALVPFIALGVVTVLNSKPTYKSGGSFLVNRTTLVDPDGATFNGTPAAVTSLQISTLLGTDEFLARVITKAKEDGDVPLAPEKVRSSIAIGAVGDDLVTVTATTADPGLSLRLAEATLASFPEWLKQKLADQSGTTTPGQEPSEEVKQGQAQIAARYQTVDQPQLGLEQPHRKKDVLTVAMFFILGLMVSAAALVLATLMDRSVRYGEEIETQLHVPVLASVPNSRAAIKPLVV